MRTSQNTLKTISTIGIDVGKNTVHLVGLDKRGAIVLQQKVTRLQLGRRLSNIPRCLIGMEACSGTHFIARQLTALGHDVRLIPAQYVKPFLTRTEWRSCGAVPRVGLARSQTYCCSRCSWRQCSTAAVRSASTKSSEDNRSV
jgi:transposase